MNRRADHERDRRSIGGRAPSDKNMQSPRTGHVRLAQITALALSARNQAVILVWHNRPATLAVVVSSCGVCSARSLFAAMYTAFTQREASFCDAP